MRRLLCLMSLLAALSALSWVEAVESDSVYQIGDLPVYVEQEGGEMLEYALVAVPTSNINSSYGVGTSNISIFGPIASKLPYGTHYVYWREGQYTYCFAYSGTISFENGRFFGQDVTVITYETNNSYNSQATFTTAQESNFTLSPGNYLVWSDLGNYPTLYERGGEDYAKTACIILASFGLYYLWHHMWADIRQRYIDR